MRTVSVVVAALALGACGQQGANTTQTEEFRPPTVGVRGDVAPRRAERFKRLDANGDGALTPDEFPKRRPERTAALDTDGNGKVSRSEFVEGAIDRFDEADTNDDGQVTPDERSAARAARQ